MLKNSSLLAKAGDEENQHVPERRGYQLPFGAALHHKRFNFSSREQICAKAEELKSSIDKKAAKPKQLPNSTTIKNDIPGSA